MLVGLGILSAEQPKLRGISAVVGMDLDKRIMTGRWLRSLCVANQ